MTTFVLLHGWWHDGSLWEPVVQTLETNRHTAYAPTIAGHGDNVDKDVTHTECVQSVVNFILDESLEDIILLGHSFSGTVIPKVAEAIPDRIQRLVFHNAFVLKDGTSVLDEIPPSYRENFRQLAEESADNAFMVPFRIWRDSFINNGDIELAQSSYEQLSPEPFQPLADKVDMEAFYSLEIPKSYLYATEDNIFPQGSEWSWHPRMSKRLGSFRMIRMPGSHETVFTNPDGLADKIVEASRE